METKKSLASIAAIVCLGFVVMMFAGCGKRETTGGVFGAASGALVGAAVGGKHAGTGALVGGLIGGVLGKEIGRSGDDEEEAENQHYKEMQHRQELAELKEQNRRMNEKWCEHCNCKVTLTNARSCPSCGSDLIREKFCTACATVFSPKTGYKFCPYCRTKTQLISR